MSNGLPVILDAIEQRSKDYYAVEINNIEIIFSLPSVKVSQQYQKLLSICQTESEINNVYDSIFDLYVQNKELKDVEADVPAGISESIARTIMLLSGGGDSSKEYTIRLFAEFRQDVGSIFAFMQRTIVQSFPSYSFSDLNDLSYPELVNIFAHAEKILLEKGIIKVPFDLFAEEEKQKPIAYRVEDVLKQDMAAQKEFSSTDSPEEMQRKAMGENIRKQAIERAQREEAEHRRRHG